VTFFDESSGFCDAELLVSSRLSSRLESSRRDILALALLVPAITLTARDGDSASNGSDDWL